MSVFETYDKTSKHYDRTRVPIGSEFILECLASHEKPLGELTVLDAGCGTGSYSRAIIGQVGRIEAVDMSAGMLDQARAKLASEAEARRIRFRQGSITELPLDGDSVDAVMINQVVHHLGDTSEDGFPRLRQVASEVARVLRPGGILTFNHTSQEQMRHAFWYYRLCPQAHDSFCRRFAPLETVRAILEDAGFVNQRSFAPLEAVFQGDAYFDGRGPLSKAWRDGDSFWAQVEPAELDRALEHVRDMYKAGALDAFVAEHDVRRPQIGQVTFLYATRC